VLLQRFVTAALRTVDDDGVPLVLFSTLPPPPPAPCINIHSNSCSTPCPFFLNKKVMFSVGMSSVPIRFHDVKDSFKFLVYVLPKQAQVLPKQAQVLPQQAHVLPKQAHVLPKQAPSTAEARTCTVEASTCTAEASTSTAKASTSTVLTDVCPDCMVTAYRC
jgi:hypothetical protein